MGEQAHLLLGSPKQARLQQRRTSFALPHAPA
jgi:hypothetical protein